MHLDNMNYHSEIYESSHIKDSCDNYCNGCISYNYDKGFNYKKYERFQPEIQIYCGGLAYYVPCINQFQFCHHCHKQWRGGINGSYLY